MLTNNLERRERKEANSIIRGGYASFALMLPQNQKARPVAVRERMIQRTKRYYARAKRC